jgi:transposase IS4-like protein/DDE family transposase
MRLAKSLAVAAALASPQSFKKFRRHLPGQWIDEALEATGTGTVRDRRLPAERIVWLLIAMGLFRDRPIVDLVDKLDVALPAPDGRGVASSAVTQARYRVGEEPLEWLFKKCGEKWSVQSADRHRFHGLSLYGMDGSLLRVPDSKTNRAYFGGPTGGKVRGNGAYPMVRMVALMVLRSHVVAAVRLTPYKVAEMTSAKEMCASIPDDSLTIFDRGFLGATLLIPLARGKRNRQWLTRAKSTTKWTVEKKLGRGDELVWMTVSAKARKQDPSLPERWLVRAIRYQRRGSEPQMLLTSLLDAKEYPASELIELYHERWELELGLDEIKTEMLDREEAIRSQLPAGVTQELWGLLLAYNLVRLEIESIAEEEKVPPVRISFVGAFREIRDEVNWLDGIRPSVIVDRLRKMRTRIRQRHLLPVRRERSYPRAVKVKITSYPKKRPPRPPTESSVK